MDALQRTLGLSGSDEVQGPAEGDGDVELTEDFEKAKENVSVYEINGIDQLFAVTLEPSNYRDEFGDWHDIDTALIQDPATGDWVNTAGPVGVAFPAKLSESAAATLSLDAGTLSLTPLGVDEGTPAVLSEEGLSYPGAAPGIELTRWATPDGFEELVVLKEPPAGDGFTWRVVASGFSLALEKTGQVSMYKGQDVVGEIPVAVASDASGESGAHPFPYGLEDLGGGEYLLSVLYDQDWLKDPATTYPVRIDPVPQQSVKQYPSVDTYVRGPNATGGCTVSGIQKTWQWVQVGGTACRLNALVKFNVDGLKSATRVVYSGQAAMLQDVHENTSSVMAYPILEDWSEDIPADWPIVDPNAFPDVDTSRFVCGQVAAPTPPPSGNPPDWWAWPYASTGSCNVNNRDFGAFYAPYVELIETTNYGVVFRNIDSDPNNLHQYRSVNYSQSASDPYLYLWYNDLPPALASNKLSCTADGITVLMDNPLLCVTAMPTDPNGNPTRISFQVSSDSSFADDKIVAESPWLDDTVSPVVYPSWTPPSGTLQDGQTYWWRAVSGDWCEWDSGTPSMCPNVDAAGYVVPRRATGSRSFTVSLPHYGTDQRWSMWSAGLGNGIGLQVNQANGNLFLSYPLDALATPVGPLAVAVTYNSRKAASSDPSKEQGLSPGWVISAGPYSDTGKLPLKVDSSLTEAQGGGINLQLNDGGIAHFAPLSQGDFHYVGSGDWAGTVTRNDNATGDQTKWTFTTSTGGTYEFRADGGSIKSATPATNAWDHFGLTYTFNTTGWAFPVVTSVKDPLNRMVSFSWSSPSAPRLQSIVTWVPCPAPYTVDCPSGGSETWTFSYDGSSRLQTIKDPAGQIVTFSYDPVSPNLVAGIQDGEQTFAGLGHKTAIAYTTGAGAPRVSTVLPAGGADPVTGLVPTATQFFYGTASSGDLVDQSWVTDPRGTATGVADDYTVWTDFDLAGRPTRVFGPYRLNPDGTPFVSTNPQEVPIARMVWNAQGNLLCQRTPFQSSKEGDDSCIAPTQITADQYQTDYEYVATAPFPVKEMTGPLVAPAASRPVSDYVYDSGFGGLLRYAYDGKYLAGLPFHAKIDGNINFDNRQDFCNPSPNCDDIEYGDAYWSVKWTGVLVPAITGGYQFKTLSAHGATISIGSQGVLGCWDTANPQHQVLTNCGTDPAPNYFPTLQLTAGKSYPISISYFWDDDTQGEPPTLKFHWKKPGDGTFSPVPSTVLKPNLTLATSMTRTPGPAGTESSVTTTWEYDPDNGDLDRLHRRPTTVTTTGQPSNQSRVVEYDYDAVYGFVTDESVTLGAGSLTTHTDYNLDVSTGAGFCRKRVLDPVQNAERLGGSTDYGYTDYLCDASGEVTKVTTYIPAIGGQAAQTRVARTEYDQVGRVARTSLPHAGADDPATWPPGVGWTVNTYDRAGRLKTATDPLGAVTTTLYNDQGRAWKVTAPDPDGGGPKAAPITLWGYERAGNRTDTYDPLAGGAPSGEHHWITSFDPQNREVSRTIPTSTAQNPGTTYTVTTAYDLATLKTVVSTPGGPAAGGGNVTITSTTSYDLAGQKVAEQLGTRTASTFTYDLWGNVQSQVVSGVQTDFTYNAWAQVATKTCKGCGPTGLDTATTHTYDQAGRMTTMVDARAANPGDLDHTWTYEYDGAGRLTKSKLPLNVGYPPGSDGITTLTYNSAGDRIKVKDGAGYTRQFTYDVYHPAATQLLQRVETVISPDSTSTTTHHYDLGGRLIQTDRPAGIGTRTFAFDALGRMTQRAATSGTTVTETFDYDAAGNMTAAATQGGSSQQSITFNYDYANRPWKVIEGTGASQARTVYTYTNSQLASREDRYGPSTISTSAFGYLAGDGLVGTLTWTPSGTGANTSIYAYDAYGRTIARDDPSGKRTAFGYDSASRPSSINVGTPSGPAPGVSNPVVTFTRTFDQVGNVATEARTVPGYATGDQGTWQYTYDNANRLTRATTPGGTSYRYDYDGAGSRYRVRVGSSDAQMTFDANGYPDFAVDGGVTTQYTVDAAGRLTEVITGSDTTTYVYDGLSRLKRAVRTGGTPTYDVAYTIDPLDRTVVRSPQGGTATTYAYIGTSERVAFAASSTTTQYASAPGSPLAEKPSGTPIRYYVASHHGDIVALIDSQTGQVVSGAVSAYDPFGGLRGSTTTGSELGFQGQITDSSTGLVDMLTRSYLPGLGRFATQDVVFGNPLNPASLNQFIYAHDNPVTHADPTGMYIPEYDEPNRGVYGYWAAGSGATPSKVMGSNAVSSNPQFVIRWHSGYKADRFKPGTFVMWLNTMVPKGHTYDSFGLDSADRETISWLPGFGLADAIEHGSGFDFGIEAAGLIPFGRFAKFLRFARHLDEAAEVATHLDEASRAIGNTADEWWRVSNLGRNRAGTLVPESFDLSVAGQTFTVHPNATKHMAEYATSHGGGAIPISSLAGSVETAVRGGLQSGLNFIRVGAWELGIDTRTNVIYHAVYMP